MAQENTKDKKHPAEELFGLLNKEYKEINPDEKVRIDEIVGQNPEVLRSKELAHKILDIPERRKESTAQILNNLKSLKREGYFQAVDLPVSAVSETVREERKTYEENKPRNTLEAARLAEYQGKTLTVEQKALLDKANDKKVADLENKDGDQRRGEKRESKDKFTDSDIIQYLYTDWVLGGASWLFNKTEDWLLGSVDLACEKYRKRCNNLYEGKKKDKLEEIQVAKAKALAFSELSNNTLDTFNDACVEQNNAYKEQFAELRNNLGNPNAQWNRFEPESEFINNLQSNPSAPAFLQYGEQELDNRLKMLETTGKLAIMITGMEMTDEFMRSDDVWKKKDKYKENAELKEELENRAREKQSSILEAVSVISEDTRLRAEISYEAMEGSKPDFKTYVQETVTKEVNLFLGDLAKQAQAIAGKQKAAINDDQFTVPSGRNKLDKSIASDLKNLNKLIEGTIKSGRVYDEKMFTPEHSKQRIEARVGLYDNAVRDNAPNSAENVLQSMQNLNTYNQDTLNARRANLDIRRKYLQSVREKLDKRDSSRSGVKLDKLRGRDA